MSNATARPTPKLQRHSLHHLEQIPVDSNPCHAWNDLSHYVQ